jgi:hypothetical protein
VTQNTKVSTLLIGSLIMGLSALAGLALSSSISDVIVQLAITQKLPIFPLMLTIGFISLGIGWLLNKKFKVTVPPTLAPQALIVSFAVFALDLAGFMLIIYAMLSLSLSRPL